MIIGIDASRAFLKRRTGIEEYAYQVIRHLRDVIPQGHRVVLYIRSDQDVSFDIPKNWRVKKLWAPRFWTQGRLSLEMLLHPPDVLFVPAHTVPVIHPAQNGIVFYKWDIAWLVKFFQRVSGSRRSIAADRPRKTVVTVHGLEYEFCPQSYSWWGRLYMRASIRFSVRAAQTVIAVSENTKKDVMRLYGVPEKKVRVVYEGYGQGKGGRVQGLGENFSEGRPIPSTLYPRPYLLFIGRLEERKNVVRIIEAFEILKEKYHIPHELVLVGKPGYGYEKVKSQKSKVKSRDAIIELGYVSEAEKCSLLKNADVFLFPTLYEGFGIPILEAQAAGVPVVTSQVSSLPEVAGEGAAYCDPYDSKSIAEAVQKVLSDKTFRSGIMKEAAHNVSRFSWAHCAGEISSLFRR